jgi:hypothetical protein
VLLYRFPMVDRTVEPIYRTDFGMSSTRVPFGSRTFPLSYRSAPY